MSPPDEQGRRGLCGAPGAARLCCSLEMRGTDLWGPGPFLEGSAQAWAGTRLVLIRLASAGHPRSGRPCPPPHPRAPSPPLPHRALQFPAGPAAGARAPALGLRAQHPPAAALTCRLPGFRQQGPRWDPPPRPLTAWVSRPPGVSGSAFRTLWSRLGSWGGGGARTPCWNTPTHRAQTVPSWGHEAWETRGGAHVSAPGHQVKPWGANCPHWSTLLPQGACAVGVHQLGGALGSSCRRVGGQRAQDSGGSAEKDTISTATPAPSTIGPWQSLY